MSLHRASALASLVSSLAACGHAASDGPTFGPDAATLTSHDASAAGRDVAAHDAQPSCVPPDATAFDSGAHLTGVVSATVGGPAGLFAAFSTAPFNSLGCVGPEIPQGSCCIASIEVLYSVADEPTAGTVTLIQGGRQLATTKPTSGLYDGTTVAPWAPGEELTFKAPGARFPAFAVQVEAPGLLPSVSFVQAGAANADVVSLGADLVVTWTQPSDADFVQVIVSQTTGKELCLPPPNPHGLTVQPTQPLYIICSASSARGMLTISEELFAQARFAPGTKGSVSATAVNVTDLPVATSGEADRVIAVASSPSVVAAGTLSFTR